VIEELLGELDERVGSTLVNVTLLLAALDANIFLMKYIFTTCTQIARLLILGR